MKKLINWFKARTDKQKHLIVGFICGFMYSPFVSFYDINWVIGINLLLSSMMFIGKEVYDKYKPNPTGFDKVDLFADYLGWGVGVWVSSFVVVIPVHYILQLMN